MARTVPNHDAKIGKKIDFLAAELGDALQVHQFTRKARRLWRKAGEGQQQYFHVMDLQGNKWNEGSVGKFCINIGVQFPALIRLFAELSGQAWRVELADEPDTASSCPSVRLDDALPAQREQWWPAEMDASHDIWFEIKADTDLTVLAAALRRAALEYLLPWFERNSSFDTIFATHSREMLVHCFRIICGVLAGRKEEVRALFLEKGSQWFSADMHEKTKVWLEQNGIEFGAVEYVPEPPEPRHAARVAAFETSRTNAQAMEQALARDDAPVGARLPVLLEAFHEACRTRSGENADSPIWTLLQRSDADTRRLTILTIMQRLIDAPIDIPSLHPSIWGRYPSYDGYWGELLNGLLKELPCDEAFAKALFANLPPLTKRFTRTGYICLEFTGSLRHVARYLCNEARPWSETLKPDVIHLLDLIRDVAVADFDEMEDLYAKELAKENLPIVSSEVRRNGLLDYPEQQFDKVDRETIAMLRKWLNRDAEGRDTLQIEGDDWGRQLGDALKTFPGNTSALTEMFEWFAASPPAKVTPAFAKQAHAAIATIASQSDAEQVEAWLDALLRAYANTDLTHEWATTAPRPGVGAVAGETSGNILIGLCRLAQIWQPERFAQALAVVAEAGLTVIPDARVRNQKAATAAIEAMAASASGKKLLMEMRASTKKPSIQKTIDSALAKTKEK